MVLYAGIPEHSVVLPNDCVVYHFLIPSHVALLWIDKEQLI